MSGRLGHIAGSRRVGHAPINGIRKTNYAYGFGGCDFWLTADLGTNTRTDLGAISSWTDIFFQKSFVQTTSGNQPRLILSDADFNGYSSIDFSVGSRSLIPASNFLSIGFNASSTFVFVIKNQSVGAGTNLLFSNTAGSTQTINTGSTGTGAGSDGIGVYTGSTINISGSIENTNPHICILNYNGLVIDGSLVSSASWSLGTDITQRIGFTNSNGFLGKITDVILYNFLLTTSEMIRLSNNINSKYAIY